MYNNIKDMISVVIPLYNKEAYIADTINCILEQSFKNFEIIVIDDGSKDNGSEIVTRLSNTDKRIRLIQKENGGVSSARNRGILEAKYDYIAFIDADDKWSSEHLMNIWNLINKYTEADIFTSNFARVYNYGEIKNNRNVYELPEGIISNYFKYSLKKGLINSSCVCVSKKALMNVGMFDENYSHGEDIDLWNRLVRKYKVAYTPIVSSYYIMDTENNASKVKPTKTADRYIKLSDSINYYDFKYNFIRLFKYRIKCIFKIDNINKYRQAYYRYIFKLKNKEINH